MSAVPGQDAWRDAGLEPVTVDGPRRLTDDVAEADDGPEEYRPGFARADREGRADEADVVEQDTEVALDDDQEPDAG